MVVRQETHPGTGAGACPKEFRVARESMQSARLRPEVALEEMPPPKRVAPYAAALSADVEVDGEDIATGRIILLHDPAGNDAWEGTFRLVAYVRAELDPDLITDPMLGGVGWSWLVEALEAHHAEFTAPTGSVTRVATENFGAMADEPASAQIEVRASWTPRTLDIASHVEAWGELLCATAGLQPLPEGVTAIPSPRPRADSGLRQGQST